MPGLKAPLWANAADLFVVAMKARLVRHDTGQAFIHTAEYTLTLRCNSMRHHRRKVI